MEEEKRIDSIEFAKYLLSLNNSRNTPVEMNMTKLQKLIYVCDGLLLATGTNLINEIPKVWPHGPVYPRIYKWYSPRQTYQYKEEDISKEALEIINQTQGVKDTIDAVLDVFGSWSAVALSNWSHSEGSPWFVAQADRGIGSFISKDDMRVYFRRFVNA